MAPAVFFSLAGLVALLAFFLLSIRQQKEFEERFPPISDAEFVARCSPGTTPDMALWVRQIVSHHFAIEYDRVHPSCRFLEDFGAD